MEKSVAKASTARPTVYDVARLAGVSQTTVTHALTGKRPVSKVTRERVWAAVKELDFQPNQLARAFRDRRSHAVALVVPNIAHHIAPIFARRAGTVLRQKGFTLNIHETDNDPTALAAAMDSMIGWHIDGAIFSGFELSTSDAGLLRRRSIPFVNVGIDSPAPHAWNTVRLDQEAGIQATTTLVSERSSGAIAYIGGLPGAPGSQVREMAFRAAMATADREVNERLVLSCEYAWEAGRACAAQLFQSGDDVGAVVTGNDLIALGVLVAARDAQVEVPRDVLITGFDNLEVDAMVSPALTSVETFPEQLAERAVDLLVHVIDGSDGVQNLTVAPQLVRRESA